MPLAHLLHDMNFIALSETVAATIDTNQHGEQEEEKELGAISIDIAI